MPVWKFILAYDGTCFHGWQVQPGLPTVQGHLAAAIERVTGERVLPQGSGRTDAGVHALGQVASCTLTAAIPPGNLVRALNRILPGSVRVLTATPMSGSFHARHDALRKTYLYRIFPRVPASRDEADDEDICPPMLAPFAWDCPWRLDVEALQSAARQVVGTHDFSSFAASDPDVATRAQSVSPPGAVRTIDTSAWTEEDGLLVYRVTGSGFLHHMVRTLVGTFVECGRGAWLPARVAAILAAHDRRLAGPTAPAHGLFLHSVEYAPPAPEEQP